MKTITILTLSAALFASNAFAIQQAPRYQYFELTQPIKLVKGRSATINANGMDCRLGVSSFPTNYKQLGTSDAVDKYFDTVTHLPEMGAADLVVGPVTGVGAMVLGVPAAIAEGIHHASNKRTKEDVTLGKGFRFTLTNWQELDWLQIRGDYAPYSYGFAGYAVLNGRNYGVGMGCRPQKGAPKNKKPYMRDSIYYFPTYEDGTTDIGTFLKGKTPFAQKHPSNTQYWNAGSNNAKRLRVDSEK